MEVTLEVNSRVGGNPRRTFSGRTRWGCWRAGEGVMETSDVSDSFTALAKLIAAIALLLFIIYQGKKNS